MYIPRQKDTILIEYKGEKIHKKDEAIIDESLHVFNKQHELSEFLAGFAVECIKENKRNCNIDISRFGLPLKKVEIVIIKENLIPRPTAKLSNIDSNGFGEIVINVYKHLNLLTIDEKRLFLNIKDAVMHELGHWYFIISKYNGTENYTNNKEDDDFYEDIINVLEKGDYNSDLYKLSYAIYSVFGNELNAFVSQCHCQVRDYLIGLKELRFEFVKRALYNNEIYENFNINVENLKNILGYNDSRKSNLVREYNSVIRSKISTIEDLENIVSSYLKRNEDAVKLCDKTAVGAYYDLKEKY